MPNRFSHLQSECDRAARQFLALAAWGFNRSAVRAALHQLTSESNQPLSALAWLTEHTAKLPQRDEAERWLHYLVKTDAALRTHRARVESASPTLAYNFTPRLSCC
jgi:hypothetical protein